MRMMKKNIFFIITLLCILPLTAQDEGEQVLVFRNTGEVNLLYTNRLDSMTLSHVDAEGVLHEEPVSQVFWSQDTVMIIPIAEIDSIAFGERNVMEFQEDVKKLTHETDLPWIIRFDGISVYYRLDTPTSLLPQKGNKLFYALDGDRHSIFPYGLCARVMDVATLQNEIRVDIESVPLEEIFSKLFLAGPIHAEMKAPSSRMQAIRRAPVNTELSLDTSIDMDDVGSIDVKGQIAVDGNVIISLGFQHADLSLNYGYGVGVNIKARESATKNVELLGPETRIGTFYGLLNIEAATGAFADMEAELSLGLDIERTYTRRLLWTRRGDENSFDFHKVEGSEPYNDEARIDLTLDGSVFFGPMLRVDFVTLGDVIGARAKVKLGTEIEGKVNLGMLQNMRNYQPQAYGNAELAFQGKLVVEGYTTNRHYLVWGDLDEHKIFSLPLSFGGHTMRLFPEYTQTAASTTTLRTNNVTVSAATAVKQSTPTMLETGFELVDAKGEVVDSMFVGTIEAKSENVNTVQTFNTEMAMPETIKREDLEGCTMRPIFHYAGYTISAAPVGIKKDVLLQPYTSSLGNGAATFVSSGPFLGTAIANGTLYQVGTYLPVQLKDNVFKDRDTSPSVIVNIGTYISNSDAENLVGTWEGVLNGKEVTLTLLADGTGTYDIDRTFEYQLNNPQSGDLQLDLDDGETMVFSILSISGTKLSIIDKRDKTHTVSILTRKR